MACGPSVPSVAPFCRYPHPYDRLRVSTCMWINKVAMMRCAALLALFAASVEGASADAA
ncbi:hypothetical protein KIN20_017097 [Parelaphostrongylus tenuis]|uniref:Uncharacterized protein n=1 Tax=Parelaphostrongylus tenuis TaxID=148309 RepID=A0AAD5N272_PARTN|nr:hypothetical protein KIN20_017097 [Parelaphostrongylus tenuis]